ncbi:hypothetical protein NXS19_008847 [Fusarium pseudograminearum]|uniref:Uncharacterized protein n=1 Tax=Fusarium pseudograminearum (strain CS3096) TaxID=1028729 RepID=K3VZL5_FUSPC|nr:hypothetical protein FPSE_07247 [Fusarium pseudograminearum CS3096]EKJ72610.1 hypothetical protein FPSE_07247 [Fusarium pseudograminearum CS3096]UZP41031.1 hypothetical protein NXS19_008847 [Fusarium pseudograminearum]
MPRKSTTQADPAPDTPDTLLRQTRARSKLTDASPLMQGLDHRGRPQGPLIEKPKAKPKTKATDEVAPKSKGSLKPALKKANNKLRRKQKVAFRAQVSHVSDDESENSPVEEDDDAAQDAADNDDDNSNDAPPAQNSDDQVPDEEDSEMSDAPDSPGSDDSEPPSPAQNPEDGTNDDSPESPTSPQNNNNSGLPDAPDAPTPTPTANQGDDGGNAPVEHVSDPEDSDFSDNSLSASEPAAHAKVLTPISVPSSGNLSPLIMPHLDPEIPGLYGSGVRARPHYGWYEQYHLTGLDCAKVHGCTHNPGRVCHSCHADWHKAWSVYFKAHELLDEAVANAEQYLTDTGVDVRKDYLGHLLEGSGWEVLALELQPPAGNSIRLHPTRIAKHRLALAQVATDMEE